MNVLVTGVSGFVGGATAAHLARANLSATVRGAVRGSRATGLWFGENIAVGDLGVETDWTRALGQMDAVVHSAARVHMMRDTAADPLAEFRRVNVAATLNLARQAARAGVRRMVFISSVKVNGGYSEKDRPYTAEDPPAPNDPYGISKLEAERGLLACARETGMEVVILRPVLVYGPGVKANFLSMMRWLQRGIPLPLGAIHNQRSLVALDNLVDLIATALRHPAAVNQVFMASDGDDLSTTELIRRTAVAMGVRARLMPVPEALIWSAARLSGRTEVARRLCGSLQVDIRKTRALLGWSPPVSVETALQRTVEHFLSQPSIAGQTCT